MASNSVAVFIPDSDGNDVTMGEKNRARLSKCTIFTAFCSVLSLLISTSFMVVWFLDLRYNIQTVGPVVVNAPQASGLIQNDTAYNSGAVPFETYQFYMDQRKSHGAKSLIWKQHTNGPHVLATSGGCVKTSLGGTFSGTATISLRFNSSSTDLYLTVSATLKRPGTDATFINKVAEPVPQVNTNSTVYKPVTLHFTEDMVQPGDELCINIRWDQIHISHVDNFWTLTRTANL